MYSIKKEEKTGDIWDAPKLLSESNFFYGKNLKRARWDSDSTGRICICNSNNSGGVANWNPDRAGDESNLGRAELEPKRFQAT